MECARSGPAGARDLCRMLTGMKKAGVYVVAQDVTVWTSRAIDQ